MADHVAEPQRMQSPQKEEAVSALSDAPSIADFAKARAGAYLVGVTRIGKVGTATTALATLGLARLHRRGRARQGLALLAAAGAFAYWRRRD